MEKIEDFFRNIYNFLYNLITLRRLLWKFRSWDYSYYIDANIELLNRMKLAQEEFEETKVLKSIERVIKLLEEANKSNCIDEDETLLKIAFKNIGDNILTWWT